MGKARIDKSKVLTAFHKFHDEHGHPPSVAQVGDTLGIVSRNDSYRIVTPLLWDLVNDGQLAVKPYSNTRFFRLPTDPAVSKVLRWK